MQQTHLGDLFLDQSKDLFWMINTEFQLIYANKSFLNLVKEVTGKDKNINESVFSNSFGEGYNEKWQAYYSRALAGEYFEVEDQYNHVPSNEIRFGQNKFEPLRGDDQKVFAVACQSRDITSTVKQRYRADLQSDQRFNALVQEGSDLIGILDSAGNYIYVSSTSTAILGVSPEEFIGKNVLDFIHPEDVERILLSLQKIATETRVAIEPFRFQNHKKEWRWLETVLTDRLDNPAVNGIVVNSRDITDKIEKEQKLKLFDSVITNTKDAILITEAEPFSEPGPKILYVNKAFTKMTGYEVEEVIGKTPRILQGPNSNKQELAKLGRAIKNWQSYEITTINYKKNGEEFWMNLAVTPVADEKGRYTHWIAVERDVTEQKIKEQETALLAQISVDFKIENDYTIASNELCKSISEIGDFDWVELWTSNLEKNQMLLFSHYTANREDEKFYTNSPEFMALQKTEGLENKLWSEGVQLLWSDNKRSEGFIRRAAAKEIGLKSVIGIPLVYNNEVLGVLKIGTKLSANYLSNYLPIFQRLEVFIGSELNRKKLENDFNHLFNAIPDIICEFDFQGRFLKINKSGCDLLGYREEDILYHNFQDFAHPDDKELFRNQLIDLGKEENRFEFNSRFISRENTMIWLNWYCNSSLKEGLIYATAKNITEEKKLKELNRQMRSLAKVGSWEVDLVHQSVFWSDEVHLMHETDSKTFVPSLEGSINFYRPDFRQLVQLNLDACIKTGVQTDFEAALVTANKNEIWVRAIGNAEFINGQCTRIYGSFQNINDRKQAENRLQSLADSLPGVVFQYLLYPDNTDRLKYVTKGAQEVWGFSSEEVLNNLELVWSGIAAGGELDKVKNSITYSIENKTKWTARWKYVMPNGELRTHLASASPNFLADGTVLFDSVILDITKEAANEALLVQYTYELERSNQELEQFAFVASHDLQEPLRMISSFMDLLQRKYGDQIDEKGNQYIHFAADGAKRMRAIILDLLDYSRASKSIEGKEDVDLKEVIADFKQLRRKLISEKSANITVGDLPILHTYKAAIVQVFHCLLDNALTYTEAGSPPMVEINVLEKTDEWEFCIKDKGIGIELQFYDKIFVIFQRLHNRDKYNGTGMGLSIAKKHVEFLGGRIWLESKPKEGSVFYFIIPKTK